MKDCESWIMMHNEKGQCHDLFCFAVTGLHTNCTPILNNRSRTWSLLLLLFWFVLWRHWSRTLSYRRHMAAHSVRQLRLSLHPNFRLSWCLQLCIRIIRGLNGKYLVNGQQHWWHQPGSEASKSKLGQLFRRINRSRARAGYHRVCQSNIKLVGGFKHDFYCPFHIWDVTLPIDEVIFFKMVIAPPIRNGFCVYRRGNPLIVTESRWFNVLDVCRIPVAQAGMGRMLLMCFFISPVAGWRSKKNKMFPVGCFGGLACLGIQD